MKHALPHLGAIGTSLLNPWAWPGQVVECPFGSSWRQRHAAFSQFPPLPPSRPSFALGARARGALGAFRAGGSGTFGRMGCCGFLFCGCVRGLCLVGLVLALVWVWFVPLGCGRVLPVFLFLAVGLVLVVSPWCGGSELVFALLRWACVALVLRVGLCLVLCVCVCGACVRVAAGRSGTRVWCFLLSLLPLLLCAASGGATYDGEEAGVEEEVCLPSFSPALLLLSLLPLLVEG